MGLFTATSRQEAKERATFISKRSGFASDAIKDYKRGKIDSEDLRRELSRHDSYFQHVDTKELKKSF